MLSVFSGQFVVNIVEAIAVRQVLIFTKDISFSSVVMKCDSKQVIDHLSSLKLDDIYFYVVIEDCLNFKCFSETINFNHVHQDTNSVAYYLAKLVQSIILLFFYTFIFLKQFTKNKIKHVNMLQQMKRS